MSDVSRGAQTSSHMVYITELARGDCAHHESGDNTRSRRRDQTTVKS